MMLHHELAELFYAMDRKDRREIGVDIPIPVMGQLVADGYLVFDGSTPDGACRLALGERGKLVARHGKN